MTYESAIRKFLSYPDEKLAELLLAESENPGWTNSRAIYLTALKRVIHARITNFS
jgi:hypothetical protein